MRIKVSHEALEESSTEREAESQESLLSDSHSTHQRHHSDQCQFLNLESMPLPRWQPQPNCSSAKSSVFLYY